jgi:hypothetical protein
MIVIVILLCGLAYDLYPMMTLSRRRAQFRSIAAPGKHWPTVAAQLDQEHFFGIDIGTRQPFPPFVAVFLYQRESYVECHFLDLVAQLLRYFPETPWQNAPPEWLAQRDAKKWAVASLDTSGTVLRVDTTGTSLRFE